MVEALITRPGRPALRKKGLYKHNIYKYFTFVNVFWPSFANKNSCMFIL